jgi:hypothetical protein
MSDKKIIKKLTNPYKITLYQNGDNKNIYYYFTWNKKSYRGSTGTYDLNDSINKMSEIFSDIKNGRREKGKVKITKFEDVVKQFLKYIRDHVGQRTFDDYQRGSKFLLQKFKGKDVQTLCKKLEYESYKTWRKEYYERYKDKRIRKYRRNGKLLKTKEFNHVGNVVINREIRLLVSILKYGKEYIELFKGIDIPSYDKRSKLPERRRDEILSEEECKKIIDHWMLKNPLYGHMINFLSNSGVRYPVNSRHNRASVFRRNEASTKGSKTILDTSFKTSFSPPFWS